MDGSMDSMLVEALVEGYRNALMENAFTDFGKKILKGTIIAAMGLGLLSHADAAPKDSGINKGKAKTTVNVKQQKTKNMTVTKAQVYNLAANDAYNDRVTELLKQMVEKYPNASEQRLYNKACMQAMQEVIDGKIK